MASKVFFQMKFEVEFTIYSYNFFRITAILWQQELQFQ
jgi:hypothetical protein